MGYFSEVWAVFQRGILVLWRNKILLFGNVVLPIAVIVIMGPAADMESFGQLSFEELATGILCMMIFFSGMFIPNNIILDRETKYLNILFVAPCHRSAIILGYSLVGAVRSLIQVIIIYVGACIISFYMEYAIYFSFGIFFGLIGIAILVTIFVGGFMTIIASYSKNSETFFLLSSMIGTPLIFVSNAFFSPESLPFNLGVFGRFNPLNHVVNTVRYLFFGEYYPGTTDPVLSAGVTPWEGPVLIIILAIVFTLLGTYIFVRTEKK
ncbi:MAG: ABC transporter permease [Candidatus Helarchaeota archaeon]